MIFIALSLTAFLLLVFLVQTGKTYTLDLIIQKQAIKYRYTWLTPIMHFVTWLGLPQGMLVLMFIFYCLAPSLYYPNIAMIGLIIGGISNPLLKRVFKRTRPNIHRLIHESDFSFPSSHSLAASLILTPINYQLINYPLLSFVISCFILTIAYSRLYLGIHWFTDILAGLILGQVIIHTLLIL